MRKNITFIFFYILVTLISFSISTIIFYDNQLSNISEIKNTQYNSMGEYITYILLNSHDFYNQIMLLLYSTVYKATPEDSSLLWMVIAKNIEHKSMTEEAIQLYYSIYIDKALVISYENTCFLKNKILDLNLKK